MRSSSEYRYRAFALREIARRAADPAGRERLNGIAEGYERLATALDHRSVCAAYA
jgi:hypothetical protein